MSLQPYYIEGYNSGLEQNRKPFLLIDTAFPTLENAYTFRERVRKRQGLQLVGRLRRVLTAQALGNTVGAQLVYNFTDIFATLLITGENAEIEPGSLVITIAAPDAATFTDQGDGTFLVTGVGVSAGSFVNYVTGEVNLVISAAVGGAAITANINYFPGLPVMGILEREVANVNNEQTIVFDTRYAYSYASQSFQEFITGTTWSGDDSEFFWGTNYRGSVPSDRLFFVTNFVNNAANPIRYTDGVSWTSFFPILTQSGGVATRTFLTQARIIIPYYGRLLALNVWETGADGAGNPDFLNTSNIFNRCRFSQIGSPISVDAWRSDQFGKGGFIDAPTNEIIISATFYKNTLIVFFEKTTWQLRYVGEYGLPFIWERISSDFGSESTFSTILFDEGVLGVGDRAIISSSGVNVQRIDLQIPDIVFSFKNRENGHRRVHGIRDFQKELVFWCYPSGQLDRKFPNYSLVYNYRNNTYSIFRNNVTAFGRLGSPSGISWDSEDVTWDDDIAWDTFIQEEFLDTISGNQQGYIHFYGDPNSETIADSDVPAFDQESLSITDISLTPLPITLTVLNHNLEEGEIIYITGLNFLDTVTSTVIPTNLNNQIYVVQTRIDEDTFTIAKWDFDNQQYVEDFSFTGSGTYVGGGQVTLFPKIDIITKDFNPFSKKGGQCKMPYFDLLTDATDNAAISIELYADASLNSRSNILIGQQSSPNSLSGFGEITNATQTNPCVITTRNPHGLQDGAQVNIVSVEGMIELNGLNYVITYISPTSYSLDGIDATGFTAYDRGGSWIQSNFPFYVLGSDYQWHRFYGGVAGNFFKIRLTYDNNLMNTLTTHQQDFVLNALQLWVRPGGRSLF